MHMVEPVRLVVWDLDGTFWKGTVTEEGFVYDQATHDIVVQLAERGIVSSICSKNDYHRIREILTKAGIWDYFVLPSINWEPKGPRLRNLIDFIGLRPETVLFIDDNPLNLEEARFQIPKIQISSERIIPELLSNPFFSGKDDRGLSRLKQYKLLQKRQEDSISTGFSNADFLRTCGITVEFEFDVARHIDRAIELINRTNQLNFTKFRLPEDRAEARNQLLDLLGNGGNHAALIRVKDKYGDHGYVGFYLTTTIALVADLVHFCFSCRILNMGVETWIYRKLGRPRLRVSGEVLSDVFDESQQIDWIQQFSTDGVSAETVPSRKSRLPPVLARGGCDITAVSHYFSLASDQIVSEHNYPRGGLGIRLDHTQMLRYAIDGLTPSELEILARVGYEKEDFLTQVFKPSTISAVRIFSCWADADVPLYMHRSSGLLVPFWIPGMGRQDVTKWTQERQHELAKTDTARRAIQFLTEEFEYVGMLDEAGFKENVAKAIQQVPHELIYIICGLGKAPVFSADEKPKWPDDGKSVQNRWLEEIASEYGNVKLVDIAAAIERSSEIRSHNHFDRMVYFRLYSQIRSDVENHLPKLTVEELVG